MGPASSSIHSGRMLRRSEIDDDEGLDLEGGRDLEDRVEGGALAAAAVDLGIRQRDPRQLVHGPDQEDPFDVIRRLGLDDDTTGPVRRTGVRIDDDGAEIGEVLDEPGLGGADDIADRRGVLEAWNADHDVGVAEARDLLADGRRQHGFGHVSTVPSGGVAGRRGTRQVPAAAPAPGPRGPARRRGISDVG